MRVAALNLALKSPRVALCGPRAMKGKMEK